MAEKSKRPGFFRSMVNFPAWMGLDSIKEDAKGISQTFESLKNISLSKRVETFEEAMIRLSLDEESLKKRRRQCFYAIWLYMAVVAVLFIYAFHLLYNGHHYAALIAVILSAIAGLYSYREGFLYFQMTIRKLGCTHKEFLAFITGRR